MGAGAGTARNQLPTKGSPAPPSSGAAPSQAPAPPDAPPPLVVERKLEGDFDQLSIAQLCDLLLDINVDIQQAAPHQAAVDRFWKEIERERPRGLEHIAGPQDLRHWRVVEVLRWLERLGRLDEEVANRMELLRLLRESAHKLTSDVLEVESAQETFLRQIHGHVTLVKAATRNLMQHLAKQMVDRQESRQKDGPRKAGQANFKVIHDFRSAETLQQPPGKETEKLLDVAVGKQIEMLCEDPNGWAWCFDGRECYGWVPIGALVENASVMKTCSLGDGNKENPLRVGEHVEVVMRHYSGIALCRAMQGKQVVEGWVRDDCLLGDPTRASTKQLRALLDGLTVMDDTAKGIEASVVGWRSRQPGANTDHLESLALIRERLVRLLEEHRNISVALQTVSGVDHQLVTDVNLEQVAIPPPTLQQNLPVLPPEPHTTGPNTNLPKWVNEGERCYWYSVTQGRYMQVTIARICHVKSQVLVTFVDDPSARKVLAFEKLTDPKCPLTKHRKRRGDNEHWSSSSSSSSPDESDDESICEVTEGHRRRVEENPRTQQAARPVQDATGLQRQSLGHDTDDQSTEAGTPSGTDGGTSADGHRPITDVAAKAILKIQRVFRGYLGRRRAKRRRAQRRALASRQLRAACQAYAARLQLQRLQQEKALALRRAEAAGLVFAAVQRFSARRQLAKAHVAAKTIRAAARHHTAVTELALLAEEGARRRAEEATERERQRAEAAAQALARERAEQEAAAVQLVQSVVRRYGAVRSLEETGTRHRAALLLQASVRRHSAVQHLSERRSAAASMQKAQNCIQAAARVYSAKAVLQVAAQDARQREAQEARRQRECHDAITLVHAAVRRHLAVREVRRVARQRDSCQRLAGALKQHGSRLAFSALLDRVAEYSQRQSAALGIQASLKKKRAIMHVEVARVAARHRAATSIQRAVRGRHQRAERATAALQLQAAWRGHRDRHQVALLRVQRPAAALSIQSLWRGVLARRRAAAAKRWKEELSSAQRLQTFWRGWSTRRRLRRERAATRIQMAIRCWLAQLRVARMRLQLLQKQAAVQIQAEYRRWWQQRNFVEWRGEMASSFFAEHFPGEGLASGPGQRDSQEHQEWLLRVRQNAKWKAEKEAWGDGAEYAKRRRHLQREGEEEERAITAVVLDRGLAASIAARRQQRHRDEVLVLCRAGCSEQMQGDIHVCHLARESLLGRLALPEAAAEVASIASFAWSLMAAQCGPFILEERVRSAAGALVRRVVSEVEKVKMSCAGQRQRQSGPLVLLTEEDFQEVNHRGSERVRKLQDGHLSEVSKALASARKEAEAIVAGAQAEALHLRAEVASLRESCETKTNSKVQTLQARREQGQKQKHALHEIQVLAQVEKENLDSVLLDRKPRPKFLEQITTNVKDLQERLKALDVSGNMNNRGQHGIVAHSLRTLEGRLRKVTVKSKAIKAKEDAPGPVQESEYVQKMRERGLKEQEEFTKALEAEIAGLRERRQRRTLRKVAVLGAKLRAAYEARGQAAQQASQALRESWDIASGAANCFAGALSLARFREGLSLAASWLLKNFVPGAAVLPGLEVLQKHLRRLSPSEAEVQEEEQAAGLPPFSGLGELIQCLCEVVDAVDELRREYPDPDPSACDGGSSDEEEEEEQKEDAFKDVDDEGSSVQNSPSGGPHLPDTPTAKVGPTARDSDDSPAPQVTAEASLPQAADDVGPPSAPSTPSGSKRPRASVTRSAWESPESSPRHAVPAVPASPQGTRPPSAAAAAAKTTSSRAPSTPARPASAAGSRKAAATSPAGAGSSASGAGTRAVRELRATSIAGKQLSNSHSAPALDASLPRGAGLRAVQQARKQAQKS